MCWRFFFSLSVFFLPLGFRNSVPSICHLDVRSQGKALIQSAMQNSCLAARNLNNKEGDTQAVACEHSGGPGAPQTQNMRLDYEERMRMWSWWLVECWGIFSEKWMPGSADLGLLCLHVLAPLLLYINPELHIYFGNWMFFFDLPDSYWSPSVQSATKSMSWLLNFTPDRYVIHSRWTPCPV